MDDGFEFSRHVKSRYFTIYLKDGVDTDRLAMRIAVPAGLQTVIRSSTQSYAGSRFEDQVDLLYLAVSELLETKLKQFQSSMKVGENAEGLTAVSESLFGRPIKSGGFYVVALDCLYVDSENISLYVLGHEMAHAVMTKYFVVPPPERIQEVMAGYVEYELRKYTR